MNYRRDLLELWFTARIFGRKRLNQVAREYMRVRSRKAVFENLPLKLTQQEERLLRSIVAPESARRRGRRRIAILIIVVVVGMLVGIWSLFYIPVVDVSEYRSVADAVFSVLAAGVFLGNLYFLFKQLGTQQKLIQKLFAELSSTKESAGGANPAED